jgi:hypothetical protein
LEGFPDKRRGTNTTYRIADFGMAAFSAFFMQSPSFLDFQRRLENGHARSNCQTLFDIPEIPTDNQIRDMLDPAEPELLHLKIENETFHVLKTKGYHIEHNFGHGKQHLASILVTLNLLAFAFHTTCDAADELWRSARKKSGLAAPSLTTWPRYRLSDLRVVAGPAANACLRQTTATSSMRSDLSVPQLHGAPGIFFG